MEIGYSLSSEEHAPLDLARPLDVTVFRLVLGVVDPVIPTSKEE